MYTSKMTQFFFTTLTFLLNFTSINALPTAEIAATRSAALHPCSVFVQRWCPNCQERFDVTYYDVAWTSPWNWPKASFFTQTSLVQNVPSTGSELVQISVGSQILHITNVADASPNVGGDPGKLSFKWGDQSWNSYSAGSPCDVSPLGTNTQGWSGSVDYECRFMCDK